MFAQTHLTRHLDRNRRDGSRGVVKTIPPMRFGSFRQIRRDDRSMDWFASPIPSALKVSHPLSGFLPSAPCGDFRTTTAHRIWVFRAFLHPVSRFTSRSLSSLDVHSFVRGCACYSVQRTAFPERDTPPCVRARERFPPHSDTTLRQRCCRTAPQMGMSTTPYPATGVL